MENGRTAAEVFAPGEYVRDEMEARGWTEMELVHRLGWSIGELSALFEGDLEMTPIRAQDLGHVFGMDHVVWLNLERAYRSATPIVAN